jgi:transcriptional regulator GlxA family with amidase domain
MINVGIFIFNEVEVMDFAGPFEVFSITEDDHDKKLFKCFTISQNGMQISTRNGLIITPHFSFVNTPNIDILIIPGGYGAEKFELNNETVLNWIIEQNNKVSILASVCTGSFILAKTGLLKGLDITTHWMDIETLQTISNDFKVISNIKYIDNNHFITSAGISSGIEMSLHIVERMFDINIALKTARRMDYNWGKSET